jgi:hypothetical protein
MRLPRPAGNAGSELLFFELLTALRCAVWRPTSVWRCPTSPFLNISDCLLTAPSSSTAGSLVFSTMFGRSTQSDMVLGLLVASICLLCQTQAESVDGFEIGGECGSCAAGQFCQKKNKLYEELRSDIVASGNVDADAVAHDQALWAKYFPAEKAGTRRLTEGLAALEAIDVCLPCPTGKFQSKTRQYKCLVCPAGTYSVLISRKFGAGKSLHVMAANPPTSCSDCPAGKATTVGKCKSCAPGQFAGGAGTPICKKCREGTFQNKPGKENCRHCVGMSFTSVPGETSCTACTCPRGQFISHLKQCICLDCANGRFMPNKFRNHSTCENCPSGKWRDVSIGEHCSDCEPGTLSNVAKTSCIQSCPANTYRNSQQNGCVGCPTGKFLFEKRTTDYRSSTCVAKCPTGTFADGFSCITCSAGSFHSVSSASCLKCPAGAFIFAMWSPLTLFFAMQESTN